MKAENRVEMGEKVTGRSTGKVSMMRSLKSGESSDCMSREAAPVGKKNERHEQSGAAESEAIHSGGRHVETINDGADD